MSTQLAMIAIKQQKGFDIRQMFASMVKYCWISLHAPIPSISQADITTPQLLERVSLDAIESVVGNAIMGFSSQ